MPDLHKHTKIDRKIALWVSLLALAFLAVNLYLICTKDTMLFSLLPLFIILVYLYFTSLEKVLILTAFLVPLSINLSDFEYNIALNLPSEPLLAGLLIMYFLFSIYSGKSWPELRKHPVSIGFYIYFIILFFASINSQMPLVSWKFFFAHLWLIVPVFFIGTEVFFKKPKMQQLFIFVQVVAMFFVVLYTLVRHAGYNFSDQEGQWVVQPFYNNHAMYGAALSMFIPVIFLKATEKSKSFFQRFILFIVLVVFVFGIIFSYSRAAWLGLIVAIGIGFIISLRIKFKYLLITFFSLILIALVFQKEIIRSLEKNKQDSSDNLVENFESISNISTDASNLERINRWSCAIRMTRDFPITGTGPGTYQFLYAPYQLSRNRTVISTNAGTLGNAHSEFLGAMAESGIPGMLSVVFLVTVIFVTGFKTYIYLREKDPQKARFLIGIILGLIAYFVHGIMNNYLDNDKLALPVWGFTAIIVAMNLRMRKELQEIKEKEN